MKLLASVKTHKTHQTFRFPSSQPDVGLSYLIDEPVIVRRRERAIVRASALTGLSNVTRPAASLAGFRRSGEAQTIAQTRRGYFLRFPEAAGHDPTGHCERDGSSFPRPSISLGR